MSVKSVFCWVPKTVLSFDKESPCEKCGSTIKPSEVTRLEIEIDEKTGVDLYLRYLCQRCGQEKSVHAGSIGSLEDLCYELLIHAQGLRDAQNASESKHDKAGKITDEDVQEFVRQLNTIDNHEEFLRRFIPGQKGDGSASEGKS